MVETQQTQNGIVSLHCGDKIISTRSEDTNVLPTMDTDDGINSDSNDTMCINEKAEEELHANTGNSTIIDDDDMNGLTDTFIDDVALQSQPRVDSESDKNNVAEMDSNSNVIAKRGVCACNIDANGIEYEEGDILISCSKPCSCCSSKEDEGMEEVGSPDSAMTCIEKIESDACPVVDSADGAVSSANDANVHQPLTGAITEKTHASFVCPICLCDNDHTPGAEIEMDKLISRYFAEGEVENDLDHDVGDIDGILSQTPNISPELQGTQDGVDALFEITTYELNSCNHRFCFTCLFAYIQSKLKDGALKIPCCHLEVPDGDEVEKICNVQIEEKDIYRVVHMDLCNRSSPSDHESQKNDPNDNVHNSEETEGNSLHPLWLKYQKLKFDDQWKDSSRRCPKCDEPHLFDVESMKRHEKIFSAENNDSMSNRYNKPKRIRGGSRRRNRGGLELFLGVSGAGQQNNTTTVGETKSSVVDGDTALGQNSLSISVDEVSSDSAAIPLSHVMKTDGANEFVGEEADIETGHAPALSQCGREESGTDTKLQLSNNPVVKCQKCATEFCYFHSNAHPNEGCASYHKKTLDLERVNHEYARRTLHVKPCPSCGISVSKEGGCNQIKCGNCGIHFCWLCLTIVDDGAFPEHFRWWNLNGCPNMQLDESEQPLGCTLIMARILSVLQLIVLGIPALIMAGLSLIFCPCLVRGCGRTTREKAVNCISFWGSFLSTLLILPFTCIGMILISALYFFLAGLLFLVKVCTTPTQQNSPPREEARAADLRNSIGNSDLIRELESIFEMIEEGRQGDRQEERIDDIQGVSEDL